MSLQFREGNDATLKKYLADRLTEYKVSVAPFPPVTLTSLLFGSVFSSLSLYSASCVDMVVVLVVSSGCFFACVVVAAAGCMQSLVAHHDAVAS